MKKLILTVCLLLSTVGFLSAQSEGVVYVVFTSTMDEYVGVQHSVFDKRVPISFRYPARYYSILDRYKGYHFQFDYVNRKKEPDNPVVSKPESFLETVEYIDWDIIGPGLTKEQAETKIMEIILHPKIYFIDRNDTKDGEIKMVPVEVHRARM